MPKPDPAVSEVLPPLPPESIDVDALGAALKAGKSGEDAIKKAIAASNAPPSDELPTLGGKNKAELLEIAAAEGVSVEEGATNAEIAEVIETEREAAPAPAASHEPKPPAHPAASDTTEA